MPTATTEANLRNRLRRPAPASYSQSSGKPFPGLQTMTAEAPEEADEASQIRHQLLALELERERLQARLERIVKAQVVPPRMAPSKPAVTSGSSASEKVQLFRRLFGGRGDVFPVRWDNTKTGRSGYAPACANEWVRGVCGKPQVRCGDCPNQAFIPVTNDRVPSERRGPHTAQ